MLVGPPSVCGLSERGQAEPSKDILDYYRLLCFLMEGGHKMGHSVLDRPRPYQLSSSDVIPIAISC